MHFNALQLNVLLLRIAHVLISKSSYETSLLACTASDGSAPLGESALSYSSSETDASPDAAPVSRILEAEAAVWRPLPLLS